MTFRPTPEQARAISCLARPLCITAGAGSGKTRVLAERLAAAVDPAVPEPVEMGQALVVTFTEKAAGELAERVRRVLIERGRVGEARRVEEAWISTIHGLCGRLLRAHALEAGLDPSFSVVSAVDAAAMRDEVFECVLRDQLADGRADELVATYGVASVHDCAMSAHDRLRAMGLTSADVELEQPVDVEDALAATRRATVDWSDRLHGQPAPATTLRRVIVSVEEASEALRAIRPDGSPSAARQLALVLRAIKLSKNVGAAKELVSAIDEERLALLDLAVRARAVPLARSLLDVVRDLEQGYGAAKRQRGVLDFDDLQLHAVRLLSFPDGPADRYRDLFRVVMIDEFQDTNEVQAALADLLADGDLCTVGDERQSIYSFRFADVNVYRRHTASMLAAGAQTASLATNFRSHPDVLAFVNGVFSQPALFGDSFLRLQHGRDGSAAAAFLPLDRSRVELTLVERTGQRGETARAVEADALARRLRGLVDEGVSQGDIVVLLRSMTHAERYSDALARHGLEPAVTGGGAFFGRPEVEASLALLRAVSNPLDDEALALLLASDLASVSDDGLLALRRTAERGPLWHATATADLAPADRAAVAMAREAIERARSRRGRVSIAGILHHAVEDLDWDLRMLADGPRGRRAYANVLKLARLAESYERADGTSITGFLEHIAAKVRSADREAPAAIVDERIDAVRIMSVHASKGLEFPVVALPELGREAVRCRDTFVLEKGDRGAVLSLGLPEEGDKGKPEDRRSIWMSAARERTRALDSEEEVRLLYVACTRAKEMLLLSGTADPSKPLGERSIDRVRVALGLSDGSGGTQSLDVEGAPVRVRWLDGDVEPSSDGASRSNTGPQVPTPLDVAPPARCTTERASAHPLTVSYSSLRSFDLCPLRYFASSVARLGVATELAADGPRRFGEAAHAALRLAGGSGSAPPPERLAAIARGWGLGAEGEARLRVAVDGFVRSGLCREAHASGRAAHEVPFAVPLGITTLIGRLDLVFERADGRVVVDYKTGRDALAAGSTSPHRGQADCYALAALADGAAAVDVTFVAIETAEAGAPRAVTFSYSAADEPALRSAIGGRAAALAAGPYEPLAEYQPDACDECPAAHSICPVRGPAHRLQSATGNSSRQTPER